MKLGGCVKLGGWVKLGVSCGLCGPCGVWWGCRARCPPLASRAHAVPSGVQVAKPALLSIDDDELQKAIKAAEGAKVESKYVEDAKKRLEESLAAKQAERNKGAVGWMQACMSPDPLEIDKAVLTQAIDDAEGEKALEKDLQAARDRLSLAYKRCAEEDLRPLTVPKTDDEVHVIDGLKNTLSEAKKRGADEELIIFAEVKLDFWSKAKARREAADT